MDPLRRLEEACLASSATPRTVLLDGWIVRLSPGKAKRARSVNAFHPTATPLDEQLARCAALYAEAGLPLVFRLTPFVSPPDLDEQLARRGFTRFEPTGVMTADLAGRSITPAPAQAEHLELDAAVAAVSTLRAAAPELAASHRERLAALPLVVQGFAIHAEAALACAGLAVLDPPFVGLFDIVTAPDHRGRGHASALTAAMLAWGAAAGATTAYLQVDLDNPPARAIYHRAGFVDRYTYWYRAAP